jgi:hypothetical protein
VVVFARGVKPACVPAPFVLDGVCIVFEVKVTV